MFVFFYCLPTIPKIKLLTKSLQLLTPKYLMIFFCSFFILIAAIEGRQSILPYPRTDLHFSYLPVFVCFPHYLSLI